MHPEANQPIRPVPEAARRKLRERYEKGIFRRHTSDGGTRWEVFYLDRDGRQRQETCATLAEARRRRGELAAKPRAERAAPTRRPFAEVAEEWYATKAPRVRRRTADCHRAALDLVLLPRFGRWQLAAIDADAIARLTHDLEREGLHAIDPHRPRRPLGASSIANYLKPLQGVLALAVRRRWISANPFDVLTADDRPEKRTREAPHNWTSEELAALLAASAAQAAHEASRYDYTPMLRLAAALGLRLGELLGLRWEDFDKDADDGAGVLQIRRQWLRTGEYGDPKTKAGTRRIPLPAWLRDELITLRLESRYSQDDQPIFASRAGTPLQHRNVTRRGFEPARDAAGLPSSLTFHDLRHAAASRLINARLDPVTVATLLGHEDATTTLKVYAAQFDRLRTGEAVRAALAEAL